MAQQTIKSLMSLIISQYDIHVMEPNFKDLEPGDEPRNCWNYAPGIPGDEFETHLGEWIKLKKIRNFSNVFDALEEIFKFKDPNLAIIVVPIDADAFEKVKRAQKRGEEDFWKLKSSLFKFNIRINNPTSNVFTKIKSSKKRSPCGYLNPCNPQFYSDGKDNVFTIFKKENYQRSSGDTHYKDMRGRKKGEQRAKRSRTSYSE